MPPIGIKSLASLTQCFVHGAQFVLLDALLTEEEEEDLQQQTSVIESPALPLLSAAAAAVAKPAAL